MRIVSHLSKSKKCLGSSESWKSLFFVMLFDIKTTTTNKKTKTSWYFFKAIVNRWAWTYPDGEDEGCQSEAAGVGVEEGEQGPDDVIPGGLGVDVHRGVRHRGCSSRLLWGALHLDTVRYVTCRIHRCQLELCVWASRKTVTELRLLPQKCWFPHHRKPEVNWSHWDWLLVWYQYVTIQFPNDQTGTWLKNDGLPALG